jgi:hypothetical protein
MFRRRSASEALQTGERRMAVTIDAGDVEDIRPTDKPVVGLPSGGGSARAGLRQAPGISGPPVPSGRTTLADCACASPRFGSRCRRCPNRWIDRFWLPARPCPLRCTPRFRIAISAIGTDLPASPSGFLMTTSSLDQQLRIPSFRYKIGTTEREKKRYAAP